MQDQPIPTSFADSAKAGPVSQTNGALNVKHFRQVVLWPLQLVNPADGAPITGNHATLEALVPHCAWRQLTDEFDDVSGEFHERHYREFVSFLPHVQRFLYGDSPPKGQKPAPYDMPMRIYRRDDIKQVRIAFSGGDARIVCNVAHIDLYFFYDVDIVILACELSADDIPLAMAQEIVRSFGRAYPSGWTEDGEPIHCAKLVEWLDGNGNVLQTSDYQDRNRYLKFVGSNRSACIAKHWEFMLYPLVNQASLEAGSIRYREIEYYRMPVMSYLALDDIQQLTQADMVASGLGTVADWGTTLPFSDRFLKRFNTDYVYERLYSGGLDAPDVDTRFLTSGEAFTVISGGSSQSLIDNERGLLGQFRHQYFLLFLIAHFHKATLIMMSDRLVATLKKLDPRNPESVSDFRDETTQLQESFLRFSQRYLFTEVSGRAHMRDLFTMIGRHLKINELHQEVRGEIFDMVQYLDSNALRRQNSSMHRLTVVTIFGLVGTIATGFLGMNLIAEAEAPLPAKLGYFGIVTGLVALMTGLAVVYSKPLTRLIERLSGDNRPV